MRHEYYQTRLYYCWQNMKQRCNRKGASGYHKYGGRGISVCSEWSSFEPFKEWALQNGYTDKLTIDRIDSNGNYEPSNCRWATYEIQSRNTKLIHKTNKSGFRGVCKNGDRWRAYIQVAKKSIGLGTFEYPWTAALARDSYVATNGLEHTTNYKRD